MTDLGKIVRAGRGKVTPPQRVAPTGETDKPNIVVVIGKGGSVKSLSSSFSFSINTYMDKKEKDVQPDLPEPDPAPPLPEQPRGRREHVMRIPGKTKDENGKVVNAPGAWMDVRRIDRYATSEGSGKNFQRTELQLKWYEDKDGKVGNSKWKTTTLKIIPPDEDKDDPSLWFEVDVVDQFTVTDHDQKIVRTFKNGEDNKRRKTTPRRVTHFDTPADDDPAYDEGGIVKDYKKLPDTEDREQYLDVEIVGKFTRVDHDQRTGVSMQNKYLVKQTRPVEQDYGGAINPPWRLDPLQNIVNLQVVLGLPKYVYATGYNDGANDWLYYLDDKDALQRVALNNPIGYRGWIDYAGPANVTQPEITWSLGPQVSFNNVETSFDGIIRVFVATPRLYEVGQDPDVNHPGNVALVPATSPRFVDYKGKTVAGFSTVPTKGRKVKGLWGFSDSVARYDGAVLKWKVAFDEVDEILSGNRVVGARYPSPGFGIYELDAATGAVIDFTIIGSGGLADDGMFWETASDGSTYAGFTEEGPFDATLQTDTTIVTWKKYDDEGKVVWSKLFPAVPEGYADPYPHVVESKKGSVFLIAARVSNFEKHGTSETAAPPIVGLSYDSAVAVYDEDGKFVSQTSWGHTVERYRNVLAGGVNPDIFNNFMTVPRFVTSLGSTPRFPDAP